MSEALNEQHESPKSFKDALMQVLGDDGTKEECWGDLLNEDLLENRWYKYAEEEPKAATKHNVPRPVIHVSNEEI